MQFNARDRGTQSFKCGCGRSAVGHEGCPKALHGTKQKVSRAKGRLKQPHRMQGAVVAVTAEVKDGVNYLRTGEYGTPTRFPVFGHR